MVSLFRRVHGPGEHFSNFLMDTAKLSRDDLHEQGGAIAQLLMHKGEEIAREYEEMLVDPWWEFVVAQAPDDDVEMLYELFPMLVLYHAAAFSRRVTRYINQRPA